MKLLKIFLLFFLLHVAIHADPYSTLGVSRTDSLDTIKKIYKNKIKSVHPDLRSNWEGRMTQEDAARLTQEYNDAFADIKKNHGKATSSPFRKANTQNTGQKKWEGPNWEQQERANRQRADEAKRKQQAPPEFNANDWERKILSDYNARPGGEEKLSQYLREVANKKANPLLNKEAYVKGMSQFLASTVTPIIKSTKDARLVTEIAQALNNEEKILSIWLRSTDSKESYNTKVKALKNILSEEMWKKVTDNTLNLFYVDRTQLDESITPRPRANAATSPSSPKPQATNPRSGCVKSNLARQAYEDVMRLKDSPRKSSFEFTL